MNPLWLDNLNRLVLYNDGRLKNCECDTCEQFIARIVAMCEQRGFYCLHKTGYLYHLTDTTMPLVKSMLHWITWTTENGVHVYRLNSIDCYCNRQVVAEVRGVSVTSIAEFGYGFFASADACDGRCEDEIAILVAQAVNNGWTIMGGGVLVKRTSAEYSCYRFDYDMIAVSLVVDTGTTYQYVTCGCVTGEVSAANYALYTYLEYAACDCIDKRELILTYPEVFGVEDVSFGDDTVAELYSSNGAQPSYNDFLQQHEYCDYRNIYIVFNNECTGRTDTNARREVVVFHPPQDYIYSWEFKFGAYDISFIGHVAPFTSAADSPWPGVEWPGNSLYMYNESGVPEWGFAYTKEEAEALASQFPPPQIYLYVNCESPSRRPPVPFHMPQIVPSHAEYSEGWRKWEALGAHYELGCWYCVRYIETNEGYHVMGEEGIQRCIEIKGYENFAGYYGPEMLDARCGSAQDTLWCVDVHGMNGCQPKEWWDAIEEEYGDDDESES